MAEILRKGDVMILYKCRYGDIALTKACQLGYTIKDYMESIRAYDKVERGVSETEFRAICRKRDYFEESVLKKLYMEFDI